MTICVQRGFKYNLQTFVGDSGTVSVSGFPTDSPNYVAYMEVKGRTNLIKEVALNGESGCDFQFTPSDTKSLGVGSWNYGIKLCNTEDGSENTLIPSLCNGDVALFVVNPERVTGIDDQ